MPNYVFNKLVLTDWSKRLNENKIFLNEINNKICSKNKESKYVIDFNKIIPMPKSIKNYTRSSLDIDKLRYYILKNKLPYDVLVFKNLPVIIRNSYLSNYFIMQPKESKKIKLNSLEEYESSLENLDVIKDRSFDKKDIPVDNTVTTSKWINDGKTIFYNLKKYGCVDWYDWSITNWGTKWNAFKCDSFNDDALEYICGSAYCHFITAWDPPYPIVKKISKILKCDAMLISTFEDNANEYVKASFSGGFTRYINHSYIGRIN